MIDSVGCARQVIEVFAQDLATQNNRADANASPANFGRDEVLISLVLLGPANVSNWRLVERLGPEAAFLVTRISGPTASGAGIGNVISSPTATDFARKRDKRSLV